MCIRPGERGDVEQRFGVFGHLRQHGFEVGDELAEGVDADGGDALYGGAAGVVLDFYPGFFGVDVFVGSVCQFHDVADGAAVFALFVGAGEVVGFGGELVKERVVGQGGGKGAVKVFADKGRAAAGKVHQFADQIAVYFLPEVVEVEVKVFNARAEFAREVVAQVFRAQVLEVGLGFDEGAARFAHFFAVHREEAVAVHPARLAVARAFEHRRPEEHVEVGDVFADEVVKLGVVAFAPEGVKIEVFAVAEGAEARHVANRRIQPDVEVFAGRVRDFKAPVGRVARDVPRLQAFNEPFAQFVAHGFLQLRALQPVAQEGVKRGQVEEVMLAVALHRRRAG